MTESPNLSPPRQRSNFIAAPGLEARIAAALSDGALANGWLIAGGEGAGKATLAYRMARALLWRERPPEASTLDVPRSSQTFTLVASGGHPDLFVLERQFNEKTERYSTEILIETARDLTHFLNHTASMGGWRVAIIDTADELNRNSANALLKALEEPPPRTAIFVLSAAPGRLLATIRSRCRRIDLRPLPDDVVADLLVSEGASDKNEALKIARAAGGRPGFALTLAAGEGAQAIQALDAFWTAATHGGDVAQVAQSISGKNAENVFAHFHSMLIGRIAEQANSLAASQVTAAKAYVDLREKIDALFTRGDAVNLDRYQLVLAAGRAFKAASR